MRESRLVVCAGALSVLAGGCGNSAMVQKNATYRLPAGCGQQPMEVRVIAAGTKYAEGLEVFVCAPQRFSGRRELIVDGVSSGDSPFGEADPANRCLAAPGESRVVATAASGAAPGGGGAAAAGGPAGGALVPVAVEDVGAWPAAVCEKHGLVDTTIFMHTTWTSSYGAVFEPGAEIRIKFWPEIPADLGGGFVVVHHYEHRPKDMKKVDREMAARREKEWRESTKRPPEPARATKPEPPKPKPHGPPPAARAETPPPRPNATAEWIPGYWVHVQGEWRWTTGFWRARGNDFTAATAGHWEQRGDLYIWIAITLRP